MVGGEEAALSYELRAGSYERRVSGEDQPTLAAKIRVIFGRNRGKRGKDGHPREIPFPCARDPSTRW